MADMCCVLELPTCVTLREFRTAPAVTASGFRLPQPTWSTMPRRRESNVRTAPGIPNSTFQESHPMDGRVVRGDYTRKFDKCR